VPQLSITNLADGVGSLASKINDMIAALKTAYNKLDSTNFDASSNVPRHALMRPNAYFTMNLKRETIGAGVVVTMIQDEITVPCDCTLVAVKAAIQTVAGGPVEVDLFLTRGDPAAPTPNQSILSGQIAMTAGAYPANMVKGSGTPIITSLLEDDVLSLRAVTGGGETIAILNLCLLCKALHQ
jgi:hypothetical protein